MFLPAVSNLPDADDVPFAGLEARHSPDFFRVASQVLRRWIATRGKAAAADHHMLEYSQKLLACARRRNRRSA